MSELSCCLDWTLRPASGYVEIVECVKKKENAQNGLQHICSL